MPRNLRCKFLSQGIHKATKSQFIIKRLCAGHWTTTMDDPSYRSPLHEFLYDHPLKHDRVKCTSNALSIGAFMRPVKDPSLLSLIQEEHEASLLMEYDLQRPLIRGDFKGLEAQALKNVDLLRGKGESKWRLSSSSRKRIYLSVLYAYNPEIDKTFYRLIRNHKSSEIVCITNNSHSVFASNFSIPKFDIGVYVSHFSVDNMANNNKTLKELTTLDVVYHPWCIRYPKLEKLKYMSLSEDTHEHLKEFHVVCSTMRPHRIPKDYIKMKEFPFLLDGATKD
ncbi:hypothetical protein CR513_16182, partial [Mucuna pruriens]